MFSFLVRVTPKPLFKRLRFKGFNLPLRGNKTNTCSAASRSRKLFCVALIHGAVLLALCLLATEGLMMWLF